MASVVDMKGLYNGSGGVGSDEKKVDVPGVTGILALLMWRFA